MKMKPTKERQWRKSLKLNFAVSMLRTTRAAGKQKPINE